MNSAQERMLALVLRHNPPASIEWRKVEALLLSLGARSIEGRGSRVRFELNGVVAAFHRPHPGKEIKPYQLKIIRDLLHEAGITP
ncbi:MAG: pilus assembly protein HicB [Gammaproteobacteria bacterium RIFCSPLOWO2_02_FULL_57_10]|nr:MAG: pilus assembly protein HicB [Gammaproteobacteria bacterium RIFCSPLOWO2_02_FULL_57_10]